MANWWDIAPLAETKTSASPAASANWWESAPLADAAPTPDGSGITIRPVGEQKHDRGIINAGARGVASGLTANFSDEMRGLVEASGANPDEPASVYKLLSGALKYWGGDADAKKAYETAVSRERDLTKTAEEQHPIASMGGNIAGAVALPIGVTARAVTLPGRMAAGAGVGGALGGLAGAGEGDGAADRITRGATGAAVGSALGGAAPAVIEGVVRGGRAALNPISGTIRGLTDPEGEAARRVATSIQRDIEADPNAVSRLRPEEFAASVQSGGPATIMDIGGETTRALARSAANTSPEGRAALGRTINERFDGQADRVTGWLRDTFHFPDADAQSIAIDQVARTVNKPAYAKAYFEGRSGIWDSDLSELSQAPIVKEAVGAAIKQAQNKSASGQLNERTFARWANDGKPTLEFWDLVKRQIDQEINVAKKAGRREDVGTLSEVKNTIVQKLDEAVPSYGQARAGASHFFGAQDALEAGQKFVGNSMSAAESRRGLSKMSPQERQLFQDGFVSEFIGTLDKIGDRRSVLNKIASSPAAREKLNIALGPQKAQELEAGLRVEGIMDLARNAVQGNSTTARQLAELGLAGGAYGLGSGGDILNGNPSALMSAALVYGAAKGQGKINENVARKVAELLTSNDPKNLVRGIKMIARNTFLFNSLRSADKGLARIAGEQAGGSVPALQDAGVSRAEDQPKIPRPPGQ